MNRLNRVVLALLCFELGAILIFVPWYPFWERNFFLDRYPQMIPVLLNSYVRGAISGLGLLDIWIAMTLLLRRKASRSASS